MDCKQASAVEFWSQWARHRKCAALLSQSTFQIACILPSVCANAGSDILVSISNVQNRSVFHTFRITVEVCCRPFSQCAGWPQSYCFMAEHPPIQCVHWYTTSDSLLSHCPLLHQSRLLRSVVAGPCANIKSSHGTTRAIHMHGVIALSSSNVHSKLAATVAGCTCTMRPLQS